MKLLFVPAHGLLKFCKHFRLHEDCMLGAGVGMVLHIVHVFLVDTLHDGDEIFVDLGVTWNVRFIKVEEVGADDMNTVGLVARP